VIVPEFIHGRLIGPAQLAALAALVRTHPHWSRRRLSQELCRLWQWHTPAGVLRDMAARHLLGKLEARGLVTLPARRTGGGRRPSRFIRPAGESQEPIVGALAPLQPLELTLVAPRSESANAFGYYLREYHYLGYELPIGLNLRYLVRDRHGRTLAALLFGAAAWKVAARERFIGWSSAQRRARVNWLVNNTRFLILPWVRVPHLASHLLARVSRRIAADWHAKYQAPLVALETFVERERFTGACYRAANWQRLGQSAGRSRNDTTHARRVPVKDLYFFPLCQDWRAQLCAAPEPNAAARAHTP
jgi:hypothetical protein